MIQLEDGYEQLSEYVNDTTKVKMRCPNNHIFEMTPKRWNNGIRCPECYKIKRSDEMYQYREN